MYTGTWGACARCATELVYPRVGCTYLGGVGGWVYMGGRYLIQGRVWALLAVSAVLAVMAGTWLTLAWPPLGTLRKVSHRTSTQTRGTVRLVRVQKHERGGPAKGNLILAESKSTITISYANTLEV